MIGPLERRGLAGLRAAPEVPGLPRHDRRHAGNARRLARVGDRIDRLGGRDDQHHVDLVGIDQRLRQLAGARRIGLGVAIEDVDAVGLVADLEAGSERLPREFENIAVGLAESAKLAGARADEADLQRRLGARGKRAVRAGGRREAGGAGGHDQSAPRYWLASERGEGGFGFHVFPPGRHPCHEAGASKVFTRSRRQSKSLAPATSRSFGTRLRLGPAPEAYEPPRPPRRQEEWTTDRTNHDVTIPAVVNRDGLAFDAVTRVTASRAGYPDYAAFLGSPATCRAGEKIEQCNDSEAPQF